MWRNPLICLSVAAAASAGLTSEPESTRASRKQIKPTSGPTEAASAAGGRPDGNTYQDQSRSVSNYLARPFPLWLSILRASSWSASGEREKSRNSRAARGISLRRLRAAKGGFHFYDHHDDAAADDDEDEDAGAGADGDDAARPSLGRRRQGCHCSCSCC